MVGPADADAWPPTDPAKDKDLHWRIKAKNNEQLRQEFLSIYVPRIWELGLTVPDPALALRRGRGPLGLHRAGLGRAALGGDRPRTEVAGAPGVPPPERRGDAMGPRRDPRPVRNRRRLTRRHARWHDRARRSGVGGLPAGVGGRPDDPRRQRPRAGRGAGAALRPRVLRPPPGEPSAVGRAARGDRGARTIPDLLQPPFDRSFKRPGGYIIKHKLEAAKARASQDGDAS